MSVNGGQLPGYSLIPPDLHRKNFFCTFADVEECPHSDTPTPKGSGQCSTNNAFSNMAKSKAGGSRAYIRGRIGSDVYSIGKDGKGQRQQVVRSLAEAVANPRSQSQMFGRMVMSTVMQAVSAMSEIIDHSFDGTAKGQPSISEFIRRNYALIKADATAHPSSGNTFGLVKYQEKGIRVGAYEVSNGKVELPAVVTVAANSISIDLTSAGATVGGLKTALGLGASDYITIVAIDDKNGFMFCRLRIDPSLADATVIDGTSVKTMFLTEGNKVPGLAFSNNKILIGYEDYTSEQAQGIILSKYADDAWAHSSCTLVASMPVTYKADVALPTYPTGTEKFLNGGDL